MIRVVTLGACALYNPLKVLKESQAANHLFKAMGFKQAPFALSSGAAVQLLKFCRGELDIPRSVRDLCYSDPDQVPTGRQRNVLGLGDIALIEMSTAIEIIYKGFILNNNRLKDRFLPEIIERDPRLRQVGRKWRNVGLQGMKQDVRIAAAEEMLSLLPADTENAVFVRDVIASTTVRETKVDEIAADLSYLQSQLAMPLGIVLHNFDYMPDGRPISWPSDFKGNCQKAARELGIPVYDPAPLVAQYGVQFAMKDARHYTKRFLPFVADAFHAFMLQVLGRGEINGVAQRQILSRNDGHLDDPSHEVISAGGDLEPSAGTSKGQGQPIIVVLTYGQSNAHGGGLRNVSQADRVATKEVTLPQRALMLNTGLLGVDGWELQPSSITNIVTAREDAGRGESGGLSFMRYAVSTEDAAGLPARTYLYRTFGKSGTGIGQLSKGTQQYADVEETIRLTRKIVERAGRSICVPAFIFRQGEADIDAIDFASYRSKFEKLADDVGADIKTITGQLVPSWMLLCVLSAPGLPDHSTSYITRAQIEAIGAENTRIFPSICPYWMNRDYGFIRDGAVHWKPLAKAFISEYEARAMRILTEALATNQNIRMGEPIVRRVFDGKNWRVETVPFESAPRTDPQSILRKGNTISGEVFFAEGGLHTFTGFRLPAKNHGFAWSGTESIVAVSTDNSGPRPRWQVELDSWSGGGGLLTYAVEISSTTSKDDGPACHGDIFDDCQEVSIATGLRLRSGMLPFWANVA